MPSPFPDFAPPGAALLPAPPASCAVRTRRDDAASARGYPVVPMGNPFLRGNYARIPPGPVLFLGAADGVDTLEFARRGRAVTVFDEEDQSLPLPDFRFAPVGCWRLGYQRWAGIVCLGAAWPADIRRRLFSQVPNALQPGGVFLLEACAMGLAGPVHLDDHRLDPEEVRPELDLLTFSRFATVPRPVATAGGGLVSAAVLQVVGTHGDAATR